MELLTSFLVFGAVVMAVMAAGLVLNPGLTSRRLARLGASPLDPLVRSRHDRGPGLLDDRKSFLVRALAPLAGGAAKAGTEAFSRQRMRLVRAGFRTDSALVTYLGGRTALTIALPVIAWFSPLRLMVPQSIEILVPVLAMAIGYVGPSFYLDRRTRRRQDSIDRDLPSALDLMVVCIEAGLGLVQSLKRVGEEFRSSCPIIAEEFELVSLETRTGKGSIDALRGLASRTGVQEVSVLVAMLAQTERFGTNLADALRVHCDTMRIKRLQRAEEHAAKAPLKMLFPTSLILFSLVGLILGLAAIRASQLFGG